MVVIAGGRIGIPVHERRAIECGVRWSGIHISARSRTERMGEENRQQAAADEWDEGGDHETGLHSDRESAPTAEQGEQANAAKCNALDRSGGASQVKFHCWGFHMTGMQWRSSHIRVLHLH